MNAILEQINSAGLRFVEFALPMFVQSGVLILILLLADFALRKKVRAVFRYGIWLLVLVKLVLPTSLSTPVSLGYFFGDELASVNINRPAPETEPTEPAPAIVPPNIDLTNIQTDRFTPAPAPIIPATGPILTEPAQPPAKSAAPLSWQGTVFILWLVVVSAMGLLLLQRAIFVRGLVAQAKEANELLADTLDSCRERIRVKRKIGLKISAKATSPAVCGLFRPAILVPKNLASSFNKSQLQVVLLHELAHIRRGDLWINLAQTFLQIIYFYNPLLWLANAIIRRTREQAVDEMVLVAMGEKAQQYPQTLVDVARLAFKRPALSLRLIGVVESKSALAGRIKHILNRPVPKKAKLGILGLLIVIIAATILLPMATCTPDSPGLVIKGTVKDAQTGEPIAGARVFDDGYGPKPDWGQIKADVRSEWGAITNSAGEYSFLTWAEHHTIKVEAPGYKSERKILYDGHFTFNKKDVEIFDFVLESEFEPPEMNLKAKPTYATDEPIELYLSWADNGWVQTTDNRAPENEGRWILFLRVNGADYGQGEYPILVPEYITAGVVRQGRHFDAREAYSKGKRIEFPPGRYRVSYVFKDVSAARPDEPQKVVHFGDIATNEVEFDVVEGGVVEGDAVSSSRFAAKLAKGVKVELIGVCEHPSEGKQWWRPDGSFLQEKPYGTIKGDKIFFGANEKAYEFVVRLAGLADVRVNWQAVPEGGLRMTSFPYDVDGKLLPDTRVLITRFNKTTRMAQIHIWTAPKAPDKNVVQDDGWVTFKNVSLQPGQKTNVRVEEGRGENRLGPAKKEVIVSEKDKEQIARLVEKLKSKDDTVWKPAAEQLKKIGPKVARQVAELFRTATGDLHAIRVLESMATDEHVQDVMVQGLSADLHLTNSNVRHCSLIILAESGNREHVGKIIPLFQKDIETDRDYSMAEIALGRLGGDEAYNALIEGLTKKIPDQLRYMIADHLAGMGRVEAIPHLKDTLKFVDPIHPSAGARIIEAIHRLEDKTSGRTDSPPAGMYSREMREYTSGNSLNVYDLQNAKSIYVDKPPARANAEETMVTNLQALAATSKGDLIFERLSGQTRFQAYHGTMLAPLEIKTESSNEDWTSAGEQIHQNELKQLVLEYNNRNGKVVAGRIPGFRIYPFNEGDLFAALLPSGQIAILKPKNMESNPRLSAYYLDPLLALIGIARIEATQDSTADADKSQFIATLPNDVTVELVGVCEHPSEGKQWWRPDGSEIASPDNDSGLVTIAGTTFNIKVEGSNDYEVSCDELVKHDFDFISADVSVGVAAGPWHTLREIKEHQHTYSFDEFNALILPAKLEGGQYVVRIRETLPATFDHDYAKRYVIKLKDQPELINLQEYHGDIVENPGELRPVEHVYVLGSDMRDRIEYIAAQYCPRQIVTFENVSLAAGHETDMQIDVHKAPEPEFIYKDMRAPPVPVLKNLASGKIKGVPQLCFDAVHPQTLWQVTKSDKQHKPKWYFRIKGEDYPWGMTGHHAFSGYEIIEGICFPVCLADREKKWEPGDYTLAVVVENTVWWDPSGKRRFFKELATEPISFRILDSGDFASEAGDIFPNEEALKAAKSTTPSNFTTNLPNGVTVELVGICEHPSEGKQWWRPDGSVLSSPLHNLTKSTLEFDPESEREIEFDFLIKPAKDIPLSIDHKITKNKKTFATPSGGLISRNEQGQHRYVKTVLPKSLNEIDIAFGIKYQEPDDKGCEWVTFKNISLKPNFKTIVQVDIGDSESIADIQKEDSTDPWRVFSVYGIVTDERGNPVPNVIVGASCGIGTLLPTGDTITGKDGGYNLYFGPCMRFRIKDTDQWGVGLQAATIYAQKSGLYEANLCRHGNLAVSGRADYADYYKNQVGYYKGVVLPDKPYRLDFVMLPSAAIRGKLVDTKGNPISGKEIWLTGDELYPSTSVLRAIKTDKDGMFTVDSVPCKSFWFTCRYRLSRDEVRTGPIKFSQSGEYEITLVYNEPVFGRPTFTCSLVKSSPTGQKTDVQVEGGEGWGEAVEGLRMRLTTPSGQEYARLHTLPLVLELQNISDEAISLSRLPLWPRAEVADEDGNNLVIKEPVTISPWEGRSGYLAPNAVIRWTEWFDRFGFVDIPKAGSKLQLRFSLPIRAKGSKSSTGTAPLHFLRSNPIEIELKDVPPVPLKAGNVPGQWAAFMDFVYREHSRPGVYRAIHIDSDGYATIVSRNVGLPCSRMKVVLDREHLDKFAKLLRDNKVWKLAAVKSKTAYPDEGKLSLSLTSAGTSLTGVFPRSVTNTEPILMALDEEMRALIKTATTLWEENQKEWGEAVEGLQTCLWADKYVWSANETPEFHFAARNIGTREMTIIDDYTFINLVIIADGNWEQNQKQYLGNTDWGDLLPNERYNGKTIRINNIWESTTSEKDHPSTQPWKLSSGKHIIYMKIVAPNPRRSQPFLHIISNPVEIEILPDEKSDAQLEVEKPQSLIYHGLDLTNAPVATKKFTLTEEYPPGSRIYRMRRDITIVHHDYASTVFFISSKNLFYIQHSNPGSGDIFYGPFEGNPVQILNLQPDVQVEEETAKAGKTDAAITGLNEIEAREKASSFIGCDLPASMQDVKFFSNSMFGTYQVLVRFDIAPEDLKNLMKNSDKLPDFSDLHKNPKIHTAMVETHKVLKIDWWKQGELKSPICAEWLKRKRAMGDPRVWLYSVLKISCSRQDNSLIRVYIDFFSEPDDMPFTNPDMNREIEAPEVWSQKLAGDVFAAVIANDNNRLEALNIDSGLLSYFGGYRRDYDFSGLNRMVHYQKADRCFVIISPIRHKEVKYPDQEIRFSFKLKQGVWVAGSIESGNIGDRDDFLKKEGFEEFSRIQLTRKFTDRTQVNPANNSTVQLENKTEQSSSGGKKVTDSDLPFTFTISTLTPDGQPQPGPKTNVQGEEVTGEPTEISGIESDDRAITYASDGPVGWHALSFDGVDDCLYVAATPTLKLKPPFTIEMWLKPNFSELPNEKDSEKLWPFLSLLHKGKRLFSQEERIQAGGLMMFVGPSPRPDSNMKCSASLYLGNERGQMYQVDGFFGDRLQPTQPDWLYVSASCTRESYIPVPNQPLMIGHNIVPGGFPFKGQIAEIRIWAGIGSRDQIAQYNNKPLNGNEAGLVACWTFEQSGGQIAYDISANRNHARLGGTTETDNADPKWVNLKAASHQPGQKPDVQVNVEKADDKAQIKDVIRRLWKAIEANDIEQVAKLGPQGTFAYDNFDMKSWALKQAEEKKRILTERSRDLAEPDDIWTQGDEAIALKKMTRYYEGAHVYFFVRLPDGWKLYTMDRRLSTLTASQDYLFRDWPRTSLDNKAWREYLEAADFLHKGANRAELARRFSSIGRRYAITRKGRLCAELGILLADMAKEDKIFNEPENVQSLPAKEQISYYIFKLRDVAEQELSIPGKCRVLSHPKTPNSPAIALNNMGRAVVPAMISLLDNRRPTRSVGQPENSAVVLRYCDVALEIIEAISGQKFDKRTGRGTYLSTARENLRDRIIEDVKQWWQSNKQQPGAQVEGEKPQSLIFHGLDMTAVPYTTNFSKLPDLFEERPPGSKSYHIQKDVTAIYSGLDGTVYFIPGRNIFYVQHDLAGASTLHYYGPFDGDPYVVLKLQTYPDYFYSDLLVKSRPAIFPAKDSTTLRYEINMNGVSTAARKYYVEQVIEALKKKIDREDEFKLVWKALGQDKIEVTIPKDSEQRMKSIWGKAVEGIACAVRPVKETFMPGELLEFDVIYKNTSWQPITVCVYPDPFYVWTQLRVLDSSGMWVASGQHANGIQRPISNSDFVTLQPGETASVRQNITGSAKGKSLLKPGRYTVFASVNKINHIYGFDEFCQKNNLRPWTGVVETGRSSFKIVSNPDYQQGETVQTEVQVDGGNNAPISEASKENKKPPDSNEPSYDGRSLTELIAALGDQDFQARIKAVYHLGYIGPKARPAVPALVRALDEERLRESVLHSLGNIGVGADEAIPALIKAIAEYAPACRWIAAESLAKIGDAAVPALKKAAGSEEIYLRIWGNAALAKQQGTDSPSLRYLAQLMKSADERTTGEAVSALTMLGPISKPLVPDLIEALKNSVVPRKKIASALARIGKDAGPAVPELTKMLQDTDLGTRADAIYALSMIGGPDIAPAVPMLIRALRTHDTLHTAMASNVRNKAATALGSVGPDARPAIPALVIALDDKDEFVRANSAKAIGDIDPTDLRAVPALLEAMKDESGRVRVAAAQTLLKIGPVNKKVILAFIEAADDNWKNVSNACDTFFTFLGPQHSYVIPDLIEMLKTPNERTQSMACRALGNMGEAAAPAVPHIIEILKNAKNPRFGLEAYASGVLRKLGPKAKAAVPELIKMLGDKHKRFSAASVLEAIGPQACEAIPALQDCLGDKSRVTFARALLAINPKSEKAIQQLVRVAESAYVPDQWTNQPDAHYLLVEYGHNEKKHLHGLIGALENPNSRIRLSAAAYLGKLGAKANVAAESLGRALKDDDPQVRAMAAGAILLISLKPSERKEACNILFDLLDGKDFAGHDGLFMARVRAAEALLSFGPLEEWTVPLLIAKVQDGSMRTRVAAIRAFGNIGPGAKDALPYLKQLLKDKDWQIRHSAAQAIEKIDNKTNVQVENKTEQSSPVGKKVTDIELPFTFTINTLTPDDKPQPGPKTNVQGEEVTGEPTEISGIESDDRTITYASDGPVGRHALSFDGIDDYLYVAASPTLELKPPFTIEMWLKPDFSELPNEKASEKLWPFLSLLHKGKRLFFQEKGIQAGGFVMFVGPSPRPDSNMKCSASLYLGNERGQMYQVDSFFGDRLQPAQPGWLYVSTSCTRESYIPVPNQPLMIGHNIVPGGFPFKGQIAEIRIWTGIGSRDQIAQYNNKPLNGNEPGLVACWNFNRQGGQILYDISPNGNHARLGFTKGPDDADPKWIDLKAASHQPGQKPDVQVDVEKADDKVQIKDIIRQLWKAIEANDIEKVAKLGPQGTFAYDNFDMKSWALKQAEEKERILTERSRDLAEPDEIWTRGDEAIALKKMTRFYEGAHVYFFVRLPDGWKLYTMDRRLSTLTASQDYLFRDWPRTSLDNKAWGEYLEAADLLHKGANRAELSRRFSSIGRRYTITRNGRLCAELGTLLADMAEEDKIFNEPEDVQSLPTKEQINYYIFKLRDVAEQERSIPGKCSVLSYPETPNSPAVALKNMGRAVVPAMISLLDNRRPTRSVGQPENGAVVLRYCDVALEIIEATSGQKFDKRTERGAFLSTADETNRSAIISRAVQWWHQQTELNPDIEKKRTSPVWGDRVTDIKLPFTFTIYTLTPDDRPQPGVKIRCIHPRPERAEPIVDMIAESDENGVAKFTITKADLLTDWIYWFSLADENYVGTPEVGITPDEENWTFKVLPAEEFELQVIGDKKPVPGAKIYMHVDYNMGEERDLKRFWAFKNTRADSKGWARIRFVKGKIDMAIAAKDYASKSIRGVQLSSDKPYLIELNKGREIKGRVVDANNKPLTQVTVTAKSQEILPYDEEFILKASTDEKGRFTLDNAAPGEWEISASSENPAKPYFIAPVTMKVRSWWPARTIKMVAREGFRLKGRYVTDYKININDDGGLPYIWGWVSKPDRARMEFRTKDDGTFDIWGFPCEGQGSIEFVGVGGYHNFIKMPEEYSYFKIFGNRLNFKNVPRGTYENIEVHYLLAGRINGTVVDADGKPWPGLEVVASPRGADKTDEEGKYSIWVPPGDNVWLKVQYPKRGPIFTTDMFSVKEGQVIEKNIKTRYERGN